MKNTFKQWFLAEGWKQYVLPYLLYIGVTLGLILSFIYYPGSIIGEQTPWFISLGIAIAYFGFGFGITYHMIDAYKILEK